MLRYLTVVQQMKKLIKDKGLTVMGTTARYVCAYEKIAKPVRVSPLPSPFLLLLLSPLLLRAMCPPPLPSAPHDPLLAFPAGITEADG